MEIALAGKRLDEVVLAAGAKRGKRGGAEMVMGMRGGSPHGKNRRAS